MPDHLRVIGNGSVPSFVNNGEKVMALPEEDDQMPTRRIGRVCGTTLPDGAHAFGLVLGVHLETLEFSLGLGLAH